MNDARNVTSRGPCFSWLCCVFTIRVHGRAIQKYDCAPTSGSGEEKRLCLSVSNKGENG